MYCAKCGALNNDEANYCRSCGSRLARRSEGVGARGDQKGQGGSGSSADRGVPSNGTANTANSKTKWIALSIIQLLVALMGLLPLFTLNVPFVGGDYSLFHLMDATQFLQSYTSGATSSQFGMITVGIIVMIAMWIAAAVIGAVNIYRASRADSFLMSGFSLTAILSIICFAVSLFLNSQLTGSLGMSGGSSVSVVSVSVWVWIMLLVSIGGATAGGFFRETDRKS